MGTWSQPGQAPMDPPGANAAARQRSAPARQRSAPVKQTARHLPCLRGKSPWRKKLRAALGRMNLRLPWRKDWNVLSGHLAPQMVLPLHCRTGRWAAVFPLMVQAIQAARCRKGRNAWIGRPLAVWEEEMISRFPWQTGRNARIDTLPLACLKPMS